MRAHMAVVFHTTQSLFDGGIVTMLAPEVYKFSCREVEGFSPLSMPGVQSCDDTGNGVSLVLNDTMAPGDYTFTVGVINPAFTPAANLFSVLVLNKDSKVVDAKMKFQGPRIVQGLYLRPLVLQYSTTKPMEEAEIRITFWTSADLDPMAAIGAVRALQIAVPERFTLITRLGVDNLDGLPTPESGWHQLYYTQRLVRISFVKSMAEIPRVIPQGQYRLA